MNRFYLACLIGIAFTLPASAQFYQGSSNYAPAATQASARGLSGFANQGANVSSFSVDSGGYFGGGGSTVATPWSSQYGSYIQPSNSGVQQDAIARQQASYQGQAMSQDLQLRRLQVKRAAFDEMMYEKMNTPPPELVREEQRQSQLTRVRNSPPEDEIWSGDALNAMLINIQRIEAREGIRGYSIAIDPETLKYLNVSTTNGQSGSNELFKASTRPEWPSVFSGDDYASYRKRIEEDLKLMVLAQQSGRIDQAKSVDAQDFEPDTGHAFRGAARYVLLRLCGRTGISEQAGRGHCDSC